MCKIIDLSWLTFLFLLLNIFFLFKKGVLIFVISDTFSPFAQSDISRHWLIHLNTFGYSWKLMDTSRIFVNIQKKFTIGDFLSTYEISWITLHFCTIVDTYGHFIKKIQLHDVKRKSTSREKMSQISREKSKADMLHL